MKQSTAFALGALFAAVTAVPLEKRDYFTTTIVEDVTDTVDVFTTIFVQPGDPRLNQGQVTSSVPVTVSTPVAPTSTAQQVNQAPVAAQQKEALHVEAPAPTSTPVVVPTSTPAPSSTPAAPVVPEVKAPAPVQPSPAPVSSPGPSPSSSSGGSGSTGGSCATGGQCMAANVTTFEGVIGDAAGACGKVDSAYGENYFALASDTMGSQSNGNPLCGKEAIIKYNGQEFTGVVADKCPSTPTSCGGQSLDLSPKLFNSIFGTDTGNFHNIEWHFK